jgi:hypothetical protein
MSYLELHAVLSIYLNRLLSPDFDGPHSTGSDLHLMMTSLTHVSIIISSHTNEIQHRGQDSDAVG